MKCPRSALRTPKRNKSPSAFQTAMVVLAVSLGATLPAAATDYYVRTNGSDSNSGTSDADAWATLTKVSSMTFLPGDRIFLRRGDVWDTAAGGRKLVLNGSGGMRARITIGQYGKPGAKPVIDTGDHTVGTGVSVSSTAEPTGSSGTWTCATPGGDSSCATTT